MKRVIIVGSPRSNGRSSHVAEMLFEANIDERPEDELFLVPVSEIEVGPCIGCNACREKMPVTFKNDAGKEVVEDRYRCVFDDDMQTLYDLIDEADEVAIVSPVYFSGAPAPMKCVLDRLQPYFWRRLELRELGSIPEKRPLVLHVLGEGGDPHGYDALVSEVKSAFAMADFRLERILDWVGKVSEDGEITAEATEIRFGATQEPVQSEQLRSNAGSSTIGVSAGAGSSSSAKRESASGNKRRPKLDLSQGKQGGKPSGQKRGKRRG